MVAFKHLKQEYYEKWDYGFNAVTPNNDPEFANLSEFKEVSKTLIYYAHPYTSCDKRGIERHNSLIRRPKRDYIKNYNLEDIFNYRRMV